MAPTAVRLGELLGKEVIMAKDVIGPDAKAKAAALKEGEVLMLENVRFHKKRLKTILLLQKNWQAWLKFM